MARLKALKDEKELAAIPVDQPVLVELPSGDAGTEEGGIEAKTTTPKPDNDMGDGFAMLQKQLDEAKAAAKTESERATQERTARLAAERLADERAKEALEAKASRFDSDAELINGSLAAAQTERDAAKAAFKTAFDSGDAAAMAEAQSKIGRAEAKIVRYEEAAADVAARKEAEKNQPVRQERQLSPEDAIDQNPNLMSTERTWLKAHMDSVIDPQRNQELGVAYQRATKKGLTRGSPEYFKFIEEFMGYAQPETHDETTPDDEETIVAAPVSRETRSPSNGQPVSGNKIHLTPEQREFARSMGVSDVEYARQVQALGADKKANPQKYGYSS